MNSIMTQRHVGCW